MTLPVLPGQGIANTRFGVDQLPIGGTNIHRPFVRKTAEELHNEQLDSLVQDRDFHHPTISYLAKCNQIKLPILCDKCLETATANDECITDDNNSVGENDSDLLKPVVGNYLTYLTPCGTCEYNKKLCILYNNRRKSFIDTNSSRSPSSSHHTSPSPNPRNQRLAFSKSAPLKKQESINRNDVKENGHRNSFGDEYVETTYKSVKHIKHVKIDVRPATSRTSTTSPTKRNSPHSPTRGVNSTGNSNSNSNSSSSNNSRLSNYSPTPATYSARKKKASIKIEDAEPPMMEGDIRYKYTKSGLEIKRLNAKNSLIIDIFTPDVCRDRNEKSYSEWLNRQKEDENRKNQKYPSQIYEKQLKEVLANLKRGALTYEDWARQSYEVLILRQKIKRAKKLEDTEKNEKLTKAKEQEALNTYNLWKISKEFARHRNTYSNQITQSTSSFNGNKK